MDIFEGTSQSNEIFVKNCWYVAAWDYDVQIGELYSMSIANEPIVIYRTQSNEVIALEDRCCHRSAPLSKGRLEGDDLRCMYHGLKFDSNGKCIEIPGQDDVGEQYRVTKYPVVEKHNWIWIWMGQACPDESLIPPAVGLDDPDWTLKSGLLDYEANYLLINDNLTDLSHVAFVHAGTFGGGSEMTARIPATTTRLDRGIRVSRWSPNQPPRPGSKWLTNADEYLSYDFLVPGVLLMYAAIYPDGTAEACDYAEPGLQEEPLHANFTSQAVTGMTDSTTRYFFSWGPRTSEHLENPKVVDQMWDLANRAFLEDKIIIEAQQQSILTKPYAQTRSIVHDRGPTLMRRVIQSHISE